METSTQFVARALGLLPFPMTSKRGAPTGAQCWLCGGEVGDNPWRQDDAIAPTFTNHNQARAPQSDAVCQSCASLTRAESWQALIGRRGMTVKTWTQAGWHSYSHFVVDDGGYECPTPSRVREILLDPPSGRWLLGINPSGKKHTIFRAAIAHGDGLAVQVDENRVYAARDEFAACLADFEAMTSLGVSKDDALTGNYNSTATLRAGIAKWRPIEMRLADWRRSRRDLLDLVCFCARSASAQGFDFDAVRAAKPMHTPAPAQLPAQGSLF